MGRVSHLLGGEAVDGADVDLVRLLLHDLLLHLLAVAERQVPDVDVVLDGERELALEEKVLLHQLRLRLGVVPVAEPLEHLLVREEAGVVLAQQLGGELLVLDDNLSDRGVRCGSGCG